MISVTINGSAVTVKDGTLFSEFYNETLDTGVLVIPQVTKLTLEPMDEVVITDSAVPYTKRYLIGEYKENIVVFNTPRIYTYTISLVSPTIKLQRIVLPNRGVTQPIGATQKTIGTILSQYTDMYAPGLSLSSALVSLTENVPCPEDMWNRPTLFEVFNSLLAVVKAVVTMPDFTTISYLDLDKVGQPINTQYLTNGEASHAIDEYASAIEMEAKNAAAKKPNVKTIEWITTKTTQSEMLTTDNAELILEKPIMKIDKVTAKIILPAFSFLAKIADITDYVVEESVYRLSKVTNAAGWVTGDHKRNRLYFTEGDHVIRGLSYQESTWLVGINSYMALINVFRNAYFNVEDLDGKLTNSDINSFAFKIEYTSIDDVKFITEKTISIKHSSVLINNQDTSFVDLDALANKQLQTVNRMGNRGLVLWGRYPGYGLVPQLADTFDDYKVTHRQIIVHQTYVEAMMQLSQHHILQTLFSGIRSKRRYTQIADAGDAFISNHLNIVKLRLSLNNNSANTVLENAMLQFGRAGKGVQLAVCRTTFANNNKSVYIGVAGSAYRAGNSIVYGIRMADNFSAGLQVEYERLFVGDRYGTNYVPYVDQNGEFVYIEVDLYREYANTKLNIDDVTGQVGVYKEGLDIAREYPELDSSLLNPNNRIYTSPALFRHKDNREITAETFQFIFNRDSQVFLGDQFFEQNPLVYLSSADLPMHVRVSTTQVYTEADHQVAKGDFNPDFYVAVDGNGVGYDLDSFSSFDTDTITSWCICDSNLRVLVAANTKANRIYLNKEAS